MAEKPPGDGWWNFTEYANTARRLTCAMKILLVTVSLAAATAGTVQAEMFRPSTVAGATIGAVAGGLIGGHNGDRWAEGIVIGAVAGGLIGSAVTPRETRVYEAPSQVVYAPSIPPVATVPDAPRVIEQPTTQLVYAQPAPQVVYAPAPQVVYVPAPPRVVYVEPRPVVSFSYHRGPRYVPVQQHRPHWHRSYRDRHCR